MDPTPVVLEVLAESVIPGRYGCPGDMMEGQGWRIFEMVWL